MAQNLKISLMPSTENLLGSELIPIVQDSTNKTTTIDSIKLYTSLELNSHILDNNNPHNVTKELVGLENVDNTSDLDKPISTATQAALDNKVDTTDIENVIVKGARDVSNPTVAGITMVDLELNSESENPIANKAVANKITELEERNISFAEYTDDSEFVYKVVDKDTGVIVFGVKKINEKFFLYPFGIEVDADFVCASQKQLDDINKSTAVTSIEEVYDAEYVYKILHDGNVVFGIKLINGKYVIDGIENNSANTESFTYNDIDFQTETAVISDYNEYNNISNCGSKLISLPNGISSVSITTNGIINKQVSIPVKISQAEQTKISIAIKGYNDNGNLVFNITEFPLSTATSVNNTLTGYNYYILGCIWQRINLDLKGKNIKKIVLDFNCTAESKILIGKRIVVGNELDFTPVIIVHDGADYRCTFDYEGETVTMWSLYKKLNIPFCVAISSSANICPEVEELVAEGLCTIIGYTGSTQMVDNTIGERVSGVEKLINNGRCRASATVISNGILEDEHIWVLERAGVKLTRAGKYRYNQSEIGLFSQYGNSSVIVAEGHVITTPTRSTEFMKVPLCLWEHGIGKKTEHDIENGYISNDNEGNIQRYINTLKFLISEQNEGRVAIMNVNDFINFLK